MAALQKIRSKGVLLVTIIAVALFFFVAGDLFRGLESLFQNSSQQIGEVNGKSVSIQEYQKMIDDLEGYYEIVQQKSSFNEDELNRIKDEAWQTYIQSQLIQKQCEELGLAVSDDEVSDVIRSGYSQMLQVPIFMNQQTNRYDFSILSGFLSEYKKLKDAGIGTYILFQETYNKENYEMLHPRGPKSDYAYHTEAMDRAMEAGIDDVGIGVLYGLETYRYDFVGLLMHAEHLEAKFGCGPHTISVPRICPADDIDTADFKNVISDEIFQKIVAVLRIAVPYTGMIVSTRESAESRAKVLDLGVSQISGGSRTSVGGYTEEERHNETAQFDVSDERTLDEVVSWLLDLGYIPSFCTACYREGRTGDRFMSLAKSGQIANCCQPNALMTLKEYSEDYASAEVRTKIEKLIAAEIERVPHPKIRAKAVENIKKIALGERDFRF